MPSRLIAYAFGGILLCACASQTIVPSYVNNNPDLQVGGERPTDGMPRTESAGSFCLEVSDKWHQDGRTPDGQPLWAKDTFRRVVPCG
ncbi:MAG: hypothetical protein KDK06_16740 [Gammaproteobacteria bacterium]|nr:hypothetical protein [Gammaproteobacteria bacterium]